MSSRLVYGEDERLVRWAEERIADLPQFRPDAVAIGHERAGELVAVCVFDTFSSNDCLVHLASDGSKRWMTREFAVRVFAYPFVQLRFSRITCIVSELNLQSLDYTRKMGWVQEGVFRKAGTGGENLCVFGMLAEENRWFRCFRHNRKSI